MSMRPGASSSTTTLGAAQMAPSRRSDSNWSRRSRLSAPSTARFSAPGMPPGRAIKSKTSPATEERSQSHETCTPRAPVTTPASPPTEAATTRAPARRSTSMIMTASTSAIPGASGTRTAGSGGKGPAGGSRQIERRGSSDVGMTRAPARARLSPAEKS